MKSFRLSRPLAALAFGGMVFLGALEPAQAVSNPPIRMVDGIEVMCGGHNKAEMAFMEMVAPRWAATLEFAVSRGARGAFPSDVRVSVRDKYTGRPVLATVADGPMLVARLDPGTYDVEATVSGLTITHTITVFDGAATRTVFQWPSNFDFIAAAAAEGATLQAAGRPATTATALKTVGVAAVRGRQAAATGVDAD
ncbi:hypothetical protein [Variovorax ginsengisoli]|uniref:Carboxypeptidase regulatory-like domain-containing protein n=1 Tax=Variovorax ginsengisoli TaxID=363844 RepID=A0ABT9S5T4_9BURK|nr:hypothetical protein [Variovorax ginsengisoli]MDP9899726.1 hypothetical protein [Variovorax ginsengisoli]